MPSHQRRRRRAGPESVPNVASYEDGVDIRLLTPDTTEQVKRYIHDILDHPRSITRIKFDGSVTITPQLRLLPNHIIALILFHVSNNSKDYYQQTITDLFHCALVNKQFYMLANPLLWQGHIALANSKTPQRFVTCLENGRRHLGHQVRDLHLDGGASGGVDHGWTDLLLLRLIQHIPHLATLDMYQTSSITDASFQYLPRLCTRLTTLTLKSTCLTCPSFWALGQNCLQLRKLTLLQCHHLPPDLFDLLRLCPLEEIHISYYNTTDDNDDDDAFMTDPAMASLKQFHQLTHLKINAPYLRATAITKLLTPPSPPPPPLPLPLPLTTTGTCPTVPPPIYWPRLRELDLAPCTAMDDLTLISFLQCHPLLTTLECRAAPLLTDVSLTMMTTQWLPHLTRIKFQDAIHLSPDGVRHFIRHSSPALVSAIFDRCDRLSTSDLAPPRCDHVAFDDRRIATMRQGVEQHGSNESITSQSSHPQRTPIIAAAAAT